MKGFAVSALAILAGMFVTTDVSAEPTAIDWKALIVGTVVDGEVQNTRNSWANDYQLDDNPFLPTGENVPVLGDPCDQDGSQTWDVRFVLTGVHRTDIVEVRQTSGTLLKALTEQDPVLEVRLTSLDNCLPAVILVGSAIEAVAAWREEAMCPDTYTCPS